MIRSSESRLPTVVVLLSSYNSTTYIREQIDSILAQQGVDVRLWIRDDGSRDDTVGMIRAHWGDDPRVALSSGPNLGACQSFLETLHTCPFDGDYFGFADADDVWKSDKLAHSVDVLRNAQASDPALPRAVATRLDVVDAALQHRTYSRPPRHGLQFANALIETVATGMATVMNRPAFELLRSSRPRHAVMHDAWVYLMITAFGQFHYSPYPTVLYRQHSHNVFGTAHSLRRRLALRWQRLSRVSPFRRQAQEFLALHGAQLSPDKRRLLERYCRYPDTLLGRLGFLCRPGVVKQLPMSNAYMRLLILFGRE